MQDEFRQAMLAYIETLDRAIAVDEKLADDLAALADAIGSDPSQSSLRAAMLQDVHQHRANAVRWREQVAALKDEFADRRTARTAG